MKDLRTYLPSYLLTFLLSMVTWVIFSGLLDGYHLTLGVISAAAVSIFSTRIIFPRPLEKGLFMVWIRFAAYLPWLIIQIFLSSVHVLKLVLSPNMHELIDPHIFEFKTRMKNHTGLVTFANSITLTPGTITVRLSVFGKYVVHAIDKTSADGLPGDMEKKVAKIFNEKV